MAPHRRAIGINKGIDTVLHALAESDGFSDLRYAVVGSGTELAPLKALAKKLGLTQRVRFLTDVPDADLPALYNLATAYVGLRARRGWMSRDSGSRSRKRRRAACRSSGAERRDSRRGGRSARQACW